MTDCVHEWHFFEDSADGAFCVKGCHGRLSRKEAETRINNTEIVLANLRTLTHRDLEDGIHEQLADILESKST